MYKIKEIFGPTIQGEGGAAGTPVLFLRFSGCNKWSGREKDKAQSVCSFCDTDFVGGLSLNSDQIINQLLSLSSTVKTVVISGGEPLLQLDENLAACLVRAGFTLHLETNGSRALGSMLQYFEHISMSPKQKRAQTLLECATNVKILHPWISEGVDYESFKDFPTEAFYIQPIWKSNDPETLKIVYENSPRLKLSAQMHKYLEVL